MEHKFPQRTEEWLAARSKLALTASRFGDAVGLGVGTPLQLLQHLRQVSDSNGSETARQDGSSEYDNEAMAHGREVEPLIGEIYTILSGNKVEEASLFTPKPGTKLHGLVGASPDGKVVDTNGDVVGLVEFKAPLHQMYAGPTSNGAESRRDSTNASKPTAGTKSAGVTDSHALARALKPAGLHPSRQLYEGIPLRYLAQMQGQMAVAEVKTWCDFVAVCIRTHQVVVKRVYYSDVYWKVLSSWLHLFIVHLRYKGPESDAEFVRVYNPQLPTHLIRVEDRCRCFSSKDTEGGTGITYFVGDSGIQLPWEVLVGHLNAAAPVAARSRRPTRVSSVDSTSTDDVRKPGFAQVKPRKRTPSEVGAARQQKTTTTALLGSKGSSLNEAHVRDGAAEKSITLGNQIDALISGWEAKKRAKLGNDTK